MRSNFLISLLIVIGINTTAQTEQHISINLGDPAPPLRVREWIKGTPVQKFGKGKVYVIEFWATWCQPCIAAMPHLSELARQYEDRATIIGIDILENKSTSLKKVKTFVDSMGTRMAYRVAAQDSSFMEVGWYKAFGEPAIPISFIVDGEGKLAWIGHPMDLNKILPRILNNKWDIKVELAERKEAKRIEGLDDSLSFELNMCTGDFYKQDYIGKPDSVLLMISEMVKKEPQLKYAYLTAAHTFAALLKTDPAKAYEFGKELLIATSGDDDPPYTGIIENIIWYSDKINLPSGIYQLGAETYQARIDRIPYPKIYNMPKHYKQMAEWYWLANDRSKAIEGMQKAIEALKSKKDFSATDLSVLESRLSEFKKGSQF